ncbi:hypothetical protein CJP74_05120 [Psittacicella melopsittaci]|uniref:Phosphohistidine phosphatase SixA n=1 Tax=Psittacicella melopsittaci TaxID=2028576 RepID=A0A3A1Y415_9GAMM|nr:histidine phosphatase family protein [Psittacicella melopsittaci]RIY32150.1 hypothetical protein CJP74_05120 [Psittacicella melopsittaci]
MIVIVMRHGEAQGCHTLAGDRYRQLSPNGIKQAQEAAKAIMANPDLKVVQVLASNYDRAAQTGAQVAELTQGELSLTPDLSISGEDLHSLALKLGELEAVLKENEAVVLVSHIPIVYDLVELALGKTFAFPFYTASYVVIDYSKKKVIETSNDAKDRF